VGRHRVAAIWAALALALLAGCGDEDPQPPAPTTTTEDDASAETVDLYFTAGEQFHKVERELPEGGSPVAAATEALLEGPTESEQTGKVETQTLIPPQTELEDVTVEDGTAVVEVSDEFLGDIPADPANRSAREETELGARLSQITYTLTQFDEVEATKVVADGEPVEPALERSDYAEPDAGPVRERRPPGERAAGTRALQERLAQLRYLPKSAVDGVYGYRTEQAVMAFQAWEGLTRDGIAGPQTKGALGDATRPRPSADGPERRIEVHREKGVILLIRQGRVKRAIHVSTGAPGTETPSGTCSVFRKELQSWSVPFETWLPYASYFNQGIAFHEYPDVPPFPASHGCVRVPAPEAKLVYRFAKIGTTVVVL
jgi:hypothetical protein